MELIDQGQLQKAVAEVIRDQADSLAARVIEHLGKDRQDAPEEDELTAGPARVLTVEGRNGPAILAECPECETELLRVECFYSDYLASQHIWDSSQRAETLAAEHDADHHAAAPA